MSQLIDKRPNGKNKNAVNRHKFIRRFKGQIKKAVSDAIVERSITDLNRGEKINIPAKDILEPTFHHGAGGHREIIHPGNTDFVTGDRITRPLGGDGNGNGSANASNSGEGLDNFVFQISREEFLDLFFEDLELPDLVKTQLMRMTQDKTVRAGYTTDGMPTNINVIRSLKGALARRISLRSPHQRELLEAEKELESLLLFDKKDPRIISVQKRIEKLKAHIAAVPFIDTFDLRYNHRAKQPHPSSQAVMFCLMDVSGSMDQSKKDTAKRFFTLLYFFLTGTYDNIDLVFIRHHTIAKEVDEREFFYSRETGGTVVSSALKLMDEIIAERYPPSAWNIYAAQASDGDNWSDDSPICKEQLIARIMPKVRYYAYIEITEDSPRGLWREYLTVKKTCANFAMQRIEKIADIFPVFRKLFKKKAA